MGTIADPTITDISRPSIRTVAVETGLCLILMAVTASVWFRFQTATHLTLEDALITFQYAEHVGNGDGFVFNPGRRVQGTTTPLLTLLLAGTNTLFANGSIQATAKLMLPAFGLITILTTFALFRQLGISRKLAFVGCIILAVHPDVVWSSVGGMETPLVLCLMATSFYAVLRKRWLIAAILAGLLVLTRIDGIIWAGLIVGYIAWQTRKRAIIPVSVFALIIGAWFGFAWVYFGNPLPHSLVAKHALATCRNNTHIDLLANIDWFVGGCWLRGKEGLGPIQNGVWLTILGFGLLAVFRRRLSPTLLIPAFGFLFCTAYTVGHAPHFEWYLLPLTWASVMLGTFGLSELAIMLREHKRRHTFPRLAIPIVATVFFAFIAAGLAKRNISSLNYWAAVQHNEDVTRRGVGDWLATNTPPDAVVAMEAIGYQGYYARRQVIDLAGLVSPEVVRLIRQSDTNAQTFAKIITQLQPDYIVLRSFEVAENTHFHGGALFETTEQHAEFDRRYRLVTEFASPEAELLGALADLSIYAKRP